MEPEHSAAVSVVREEALSSRLASGPLPTPEALRYAIEIAAALQKLHETGHAFGTLDAASIVLIAGHAEVLEPEAEPSADPRDDIAQFGALLHHMLTGTPESDTAALCALPDRLRHVIATCLEPDPDRRYQRIRTVLMELRLLGVAEQRKDAAETCQSALRHEIARLEQRIDEMQSAAKLFQDQVESVLGSVLIEVRQELAASRDAARSLEEATMAHVRKLAEAQHAVESVVWHNETLLSRTLEELEAMQGRLLAA